MLDFQVLEQILVFEQVLYQKLGGDELYFQRKTSKLLILSTQSGLQSSP